MGDLQQRFYEAIRQDYPMLWRGVQEARAVAPDIVDARFEESLSWAAASFGADVIERAADGYALFTIEVNREQQEYEATGRYRFSTFEDANRHVYQQPELMRQYYWGVYAILFCWPHYVELMDFYLDRFVRRLPPGQLIEVAPGHGTWGIIAVTSRAQRDVALEGWDVSPTSLEIAPMMAAGAGVAGRCSYRVADATKIAADQSLFDAGVCCFVLEHLEQPEAFLAGFARSLKPGALAFVTLALTAGQIDHIYEFTLESEAIGMAERAGFDLVECRAARPRRTQPGARRVPRVQAMILQRRSA